MYNSYLRPLSFNYRDAHQRVLPAQEVPMKFKGEADDYQRRVRHRPVEVESEEQVVPQPPPPLPKQPDPCCCFTCFATKQEESEMCQKCVNMLCEKCRNNPDSVTMCGSCRPQLCSQCKKAFKIKQQDVELRSYPIRFKDLSTLHFLDCKCQHCHPH